MSEKFSKLKNNVFMFALIYNNFNVDFAQQILMFSFKLKLYKNCFNSKNAKMFFTHENENHIINLKFEKNYCTIHFTRFRKKNFYFFLKFLLKNLALNRIRKFFNFIETLILFAFKKNNSLRLCVR